MFNRKKDGKGETERPNVVEQAPARAAAAPVARPAMPQPVGLPERPAPGIPASGPTYRADALRRPGEALAPAARRPANNDSEDSKRLIVGRGIALSGEIAACDRLVVEGRVEATLSKSRVVEIHEVGSFKGTADVDEAVISGRFDGTLSVRGRLSVRATGCVVGEIRYGQLEVEAGGQINGALQALQQDGQPQRETKLVMAGKLGEMA
ncbi:MAG: polymer-forming cytoskeletal protein [Alphaproteobacteria bacterium]|nr:polymer-forming cytoskeletal protein [Alphaproteobacteria bacterium]